MKVLCYDCETTCLVKDTPNFYIVQISWICLDTDTGISEENDYILSVPIHITNSDIHGVNDEKSSNGYKFSEIMGIFMSDVDDCDLLVGHNLNFDINCVEIELYRQDKFDEIDTLFSKPYFDTMHESVGILSNRYAKLSDLYFYYFNKKFEHAHNAIHDVRATLACYLKLTENEILE